MLDHIIKVAKAQSLFLNLLRVMRSKAMRDLLAEYTLAEIDIELGLLVA
jgi:hypothetical protein